MINPAKIKIKRSSTARVKKLAAFTQLLEFTKEIPWAALWSLVLTVGGMILVSYFLSIGYIPDFELKDLVGTIAAVAVVGLLFFMSFGACLILPTLLFSDRIESKEKLRTYGQALVGILISVLLLLVLFGGNEQDIGRSVWIIVGFLTALAIDWMIRPKRGTFTISSAAISLLTSILWAIWAIIPMAFFAVLNDRAGESDLIALTIMSIFVVLLAIMSIELASVSPDKRIYAGIPVSLSAVLILGIVTNRPAFLPQAVFEGLGLSVERKSVTLVLSETACNAVNEKNEGFKCIFNPSSKLGSLGNIRIVNRVGTEVLIERKTDSRNTTASGEASRNKQERLIINKRDVISWSYNNGNRVK
jgi:hypothetical protein